MSFSLEGSCYKIILSWLSVSLAREDVVNSILSIYLEKRKRYFISSFRSPNFARNFAQISNIGKVNVAHQA